MRRVDIKRYLFSHKALFATLSFVLTALLLLLAQGFSTSFIDNRFADISHTQAQILSELNSIPNASNMEPGVVNSQARFVIAQTELKEGAIQELQSDLRFNTLHYGAALFSLEYSVRDLRAFNKSARATDDAFSNLATYRATLVAMQNFVEYNPRVDTTDLSLGSADSNERMSRLRNGLAQAEERLAEEPETAFTEETLRIVRSAQQAQDELEQSGEVERFISQFEELQSEFISLAHASQEETASSLRSQLIALIRNSS